MKKPELEDFMGKAMSDYTYALEKYIECLENRLNESNKTKEVISTLEGMGSLLTMNRRDGNTTRLIDYAIQIIFNGNICEVKDHYENGENTASNRRLFDSIAKRIKLEHPYHYNYNKIHFDKNRLLIYIP